MKKVVLSIATVVLLGKAALAQVPVFISGQEGYASFRIPAIIKQNNELLAFAEGRVNSAGDFGNIDIVLKRSKDGGRTWSPLEKIIENGDLQAGNPAPVVDLQDPQYPGGRIFLFYNTGDVPEKDIRKGKGIREVLFITSVDGGKTWSAPVNITASVHHPAIQGKPEDWRHYANTPGHALQLTHGKYKGRIYVAANHSAGDAKKDYTDYAAHGFFTDDHGKNFRLSETLPFAGSNESTAAVLSGDRLMMNARNQRGNIKARIVGISEDGGVTWSQTYPDLQLPDPVCEGSLLNIGWKKGKAVLAFSNAADTSKRDHLTLRISYDEGRTWSQSEVIAASQQGDDGYAAYSDLVLVSKQKIGILYEANHYKEILFNTAPVR